LQQTRNRAEWLASKVPVKASYDDAGAHAADANDRWDGGLIEELRFIEPDNIAVSCNRLNRG
jgi:hypothetical protein